jgi:acyl-CoA thioesterase
MVKNAGGDRRVVKESAHVVGRDSPAPGGQALAETALYDVGGGRYTADLPAAWTALQGVHGGFAAALAVRAVTSAVGDSSRAVRSATFGFIRGLRPGPVVYAVEQVRTGRALATFHVTVTQDDGPPAVVGRLHLSRPWEGVEFSDLTPPPATPPVEAQRFAISGDGGHIHHLVTWLHPETTLFAGRDQARWLAWTRPTPPDRVDAEWLTMVGDYFPPAVFVRNTAESRAVTIEYAVQFHTGVREIPVSAGEYVACEVHAPHSASGFAVEDGRFWAPGGTLLATVRQTRLSG